MDAYILPHVVIGASFLLSIAPYISSKTKLKFQFIAHGLLTISLLFVPTEFLKPTVVGKFTSLHSFLQSFCSAVHLGHIYLLWKTRNIAKPETAIIFSRLVTSFIFLIAKGIAAWHLSEKSTKGLAITDNFLYCSLMTDGMWFISELVRMIYNKRNCQDEIDAMVRRTTLWVQGKGTYYFENVLYVDAGLTLTYAIIHFAFPQHVLKLIIKPDNKLDSHHYLWCRLFGALNLMPAISSISAKYFSPELQTTYFASRLLTQCTVFLLNIYGHWVLGIYSANHITAFMISGFFSSFLFSAYHRAYKQYYEEDSNYPEEEEDELEDEKKTKIKSVKKNN